MAADLLALVLGAHGGQARWGRYERMSLQLAVGGPFWVRKGWPDALSGVQVQLSTREQRISFTPFLQEGQVSDFRVAPERFAILDRRGAVVEKRDRPRASMAGFDLSTPWDAVQLGYFLSYAMWTYLTEPFLLSYPGVEADEIEPWRENGETWRRLSVRFPDTIATHNADQTFYYDDSGMQRRMDYAPAVVGGSPTAHYTYDPQIFDGIVVPTRRRVFSRNPDGTADHSVSVISLDISDASFS